MTDHLARARDYIAKGDAYYARAADEIAAWLAEDASRTQMQAAEAIGRSVTWIQTTLRARRLGTEPDWQSGSTKSPKTIAREQPEKIAEAIAAAPPEAQRQIARALARDDQMAETVVDEVARRPRPITPGRDTQHEIERTADDAVAADLTAQTSGLIAKAAHINALISEGAEFRRINPKELDRLSSGLDAAVDTAGRLQQMLAEQRRLRAVEVA